MADSIDDVNPVIQPQLTIGLTENGVASKPSSSHNLHCILFGGRQVHMAGAVLLFDFVNILRTHTDWWTQVLLVLG